MAHYAFLDANNIVTEVIVGKDEGEEGRDWEQWYGEFRGQTCKRTSYNTYAGEHQLGGTPFRKNFAGVGYTYDESLDAFLPPKPYPSWVADPNTGLWKAPVQVPDDDDDNFYLWDEATVSWTLAPELEPPSEQT